MKKAVQIIFFTIIISIEIYLLSGKNSDTDTNWQVKNNGNATIIINQSEGRILDVPAICQYPELPTGCESVAATMVLQYYGVNITAEEFALNWIECNENFYSSNGELYGPDPNEVFAGNPFTENSYGCYSSPITKAVNNNSTECNATEITNKSIEELCNEYIDNDKPILIWATMGMKESKKGRTWYLEDGSEFTWIAGEHCLVLIGYNEEYYFLNDPQTGTTVAYQKDTVEKRFMELGAQAVYIYKNS